MRWIRIYRDVYDDVMRFGWEIPRLFSLAMANHFSIHAVRTSYTMSGILCFFDQACLEQSRE